MPPLKHDFADSYEPTGPFGAKGLGELGMDPTAAEISNAIFDAVGVRIKTLPITPEKVLKALKEKG
ncbi:MAG: nicotinate dehydrogenase medium molybdopterin subunit, partial [Deltaproteobacteria bacterium]|nr:nicotinate dehydrogenase medium molybdopterin subunit [Deltaproteobacteria bacterium]